MLEGEACWGSRDKNYDYSESYLPSLGHYVSRNAETNS